MEFTKSFPFKALMCLVAVPLIIVVVFWIGGVSHLRAWWFVFASIMLAIVVIATIRRYTGAPRFWQILAGGLVMVPVIIAGLSLADSYRRAAAPMSADALDERIVDLDDRIHEGLRTGDTGGRIALSAAYQQAKDKLASDLADDLTIIEETRLRGLRSNAECNAAVAKRKARFQTDSRDLAVTYGYSAVLADQSKSQVAGGGSGAWSLPEFKAPELTGKQWFTIIVVGLLTAWVARFLWVWGIQKKMRKPKEIGQILMFFVITAVAFWVAIAILNHWAEI